MNGYFFTQFKYALFSKRFLLSVLGTLLLAILTIQEYSNPHSTVVYLLDLLLNLSLFKKGIVFFAALPFVASFCDDWNNKRVNYLIIRSSKRTYIFSNIIICFTLGFAAVFIGLVLFTIFLSFRYEYNDFSLSNYEPYGIVLKHSSVLYSLIVISIFSLYSVAWSLAGLAISSVLPNKYIAYGSPVIFGYVIEALTLKLPPFLNLYQISHCYEVFGKTVYSNYIYSVSFLLFVMILFSGVFYYFTKRRIQNELV